jgi:hypothetical protein
VACAENDMHLRQIADDAARDVQHQRRSARRKMTRILSIDIEDHPPLSTTGIFGGWLGPQGPSLVSSSALIV